MSEASSTTCPKCRKTSWHPDDVRFGWCSACEMFHYAMQEPAATICLDVAMAEIQKRIRRHLPKEPFQLTFEQFTPAVGAPLSWRALIKLGSTIWKHSKNPQLSPTDALRELSELVDAHGQI